MCHAQSRTRYDTECGKRTIHRKRRDPALPALSVGACVNRLIQSRTPSHIAVIVDGNRRWAKLRLQERAAFGHRAGARKIPEFLGWCEENGVKTVTLYLLSTDNLVGRDSLELDDLFTIISDLSAVLAQRGGLAGETCR